MMIQKLKLNILPALVSTHMTEVALGLEQDLTKNRGEQYLLTPHSALRFQMAWEGYGILCSPSLLNKPTVEHAEMQKKSRFYYNDKKRRKQG